MIIRILTGAGLLLLGYYVGREIGRGESIRKELQDARNEASDKKPPQTSGEKIASRKKRSKKPNGE
jgi:hypothetical protein